MDLTPEDRALLADLAAVLRHDDPVPTKTITAALGVFTPGVDQENTPTAAPTINTSGCNG